MPNEILDGEEEPLFDFGKGSPLKEPEHAEDKHAEDKYAEELLISHSRLWLALRGATTAAISGAVGYAAVNIYHKVQEAFSGLAPEQSLTNLDDLLTKPGLYALAYSILGIAAGTAALYSAIKCTGTFLKTGETILIDKKNRTITTGTMGLRGSKAETKEYDAIVRTDISSGPLERLLNLGQVTITSACVREGSIYVDETITPYLHHPEKAAQRVMHGEPTLPQLKERLRGTAT